MSKSEPKNIKATRIEQGAKSVVSRLLHRLENQAINAAYAKESMAVLFDIGVCFPHIDPQLPLEEGLAEQLKNYSFKEKHLPINKVRKETNQFLKEISKDHPFVQELFETKLDDNNQPIIPLLDDDVCWKIMTATNRYCSEFSDLYLNLIDDIPKRRKDGWMNDFYLDFLEEGVLNAATIWQIERIRENFDGIKNLRIEVLKYHKAMKDIVNPKFLISVKKEIDRAPSMEKVKQISDNFHYSRSAIATLRKHKPYQEKLKYVSTYEDILKLIKQLTADLKKKANQSSGIFQKIFE